MSFITSSFFFTDTAPTEIYTLSLHDALPIYVDAVFESLAYGRKSLGRAGDFDHDVRAVHGLPQGLPAIRSEEHTSELQSPVHLVCRLLLEKKKKNQQN